MAAIIDPVNSKSAAVSNDRKLQTFAIALDEATNVSVANGDYYLICNYSSGHSSVSNGYTLWMQNNSSTQDCLLQSISVSTNTNTYWHLALGGTPSGTPNTATIKNLNLSSSKIAPVTAYVSSGSTALTFSTNPSRGLGGYILANTKWIENFNGSLVLGVNNSIGVLVGGGYTMVAIQFFMKTKE